MKNKLYTIEDHLKESLHDPKFLKAWRDSEVEYQLAKQLIEKRLKQKLSQRGLAKRANTTQTVISHLETMSGNPSLSVLKRVAEALNVRLTFQFK